MNYFKLRAEKIMERLNELAACSDDESCISRSFGTKAFLDAQQKIYKWMEEAGLVVRIDNIGNVRGRKQCADPFAKTFVIASHFDSVVNAGKFDGPLGVVMAIDLAENIIASGIELPFSMEIIAFSDEEGVRFTSTFLGSRVVAGSFDNKVLEAKDAVGKNLDEVLKELKYQTSILPNDIIPLAEWLGYFEIHIEQGPVLYESKDAVAVVTAIAGQKRIRVNLKGMAGHAGTVPMGMRQDALTCVAEIILAIEKYGNERKDEMVATVGKIDIPNSASNVIPGEVNFSLDLRSADEAFLSNAYSEVDVIAAGIASKRNIEIKFELVQETPPVICDPVLTELLATSMTSTGHKPVRLVSGAGHDAVPISAVAPVSMLFVRCYKGISHNPLENAEIADIASAIQVSETFLKLMVEKFNPKDPLDSSKVQSEESFG